jgi:hypothetical protein
MKSFELRRTPDYRFPISAIHASRCEANNDQS